MNCEISNSLRLYNYREFGSRWQSVCLQCRRPGFDPWVGKIPWRRKWQPTPVSLPGKSHGQRSLVGCSPRGCKESGTTEWLTLTYKFITDSKSFTFCRSVKVQEPRDRPIFIFHASFPICWSISNKRSEKEHIHKIYLEITNIRLLYFYVIVSRSKSPLQMDN